MNQLKSILENPVRSEPSVWLRRLVIIETDQPQPKFIRDIPLRRGLNIVWAQEPNEDAPDAEISGHSAGKTTLCRFIRYVLGEKNFATKRNMKMIGQSFPQGYVGAELFVRGKQWAVIRPLKKGRHSYLKENGTVEEVLVDRTIPAFEQTYAKNLGLVELLEDLECATIMETGQQIEWEHVIAWCARDQEARFQDVSGWRSPRSESEWPALQQPKADALFLMRVVLGLFSPEELSKEETLGGLRRDRDRLGKRIEELEREPQFRVNLFDKQLRRQLQALLPEKADIEVMPLKATDSLFPDLECSVSDAVRQLETEIQKIETDSATTQRELDDIGAKIREQQRKLDSLNAVIGLNTKAQTEIAASFEEREKIRKQIVDSAEMMCPYGDVLFSECSYVKTRRDNLGIHEIHDAHSAEQNEARLAEAVGRFDAQKKAIEEAIGQLSSNREAKQRNRDGYLASVREKRAQARDLNQSLGDLKISTEQKSKPTEFGELQEAKAKLKANGDLIAGIEQRLTDLIQEHNENRKRLAAIFSEAVKGVLTSGTYDGKVGLADRQLSFSVTHGPSMSGEAVETLSVLLADISALIYTAGTEKSRFPGFLLHDSPREADLGQRLYSSYFRFAAQLQKHCQSIDQCPFQYIITTTTNPPTVLQTDAWVRLRLDASSSGGLLLKRAIAGATDEPETELFSPDNS